MSYKVHYFSAPGRAEVARLCFSIGNIPYEDVNYTMETFPAFKAKAPFGQAPVLELPDGRYLAQSGAIDRYAAKLGGLYPEDSLAAAFADQACFLLSDLMEMFATTYRLPDDQKVKARQDLLAGKGGDLLAMIDKLVEGKSYVTGDKLSYADLSLFTAASSLAGGALDGVPKTLLDKYPNLKAFRNKIAQEPGVKAFYEKHTEANRVAFKPDA